MPKSRKKQNINKTEEISDQSKTSIQQKTMRTRGASKSKKTATGNKEMDKKAKEQKKVVKTERITTRRSRKNPENETLSDNSTSPSSNEENMSSHESATEEVSNESNYIEETSDNEGEVIKVIELLEDSLHDGDITHEDDESKGYELLIVEDDEEDDDDDDSDYIVIEEVSDQDHLAEYASEIYELNSDKEDDLDNTIEYEEHVIEETHVIDSEDNVIYLPENHESIPLTSNHEQCEIQSIYEIDPNRSGSNRNYIESNQTAVYVDLSNSKFNASDLQIDNLSINNIVENCMQNTLTYTANPTGILTRRSSKKIEITKSNDQTKSVSENTVYDKIQTRRTTTKPDGMIEIISPPKKEESNKIDQPKIVKVFEKLDCKNIPQSARISTRRSHINKLVNENIEQNNEVPKDKPVILTLTSIQSSKLQSFQEKIRNALNADFKDGCNDLKSREIIDNQIKLKTVPVESSEIIPKIVPISTHIETRRTRKEGQSISESSPSSDESSKLSDIKKITKTGQIDKRCKEFRLLKQTVHVNPISDGSHSEDSSTNEEESKRKKSINSERTGDKKTDSDFLNNEVSNKITETISIIKDIKPFNQNQDLKVVLQSIKINEKKETNDSDDNKSITSDTLPGNMTSGRDVITTRRQTKLPTNESVIIPNKVGRPRKYNIIESGTKKEIKTDTNDSTSTESDSDAASNRKKKLTTSESLTSPCKIGTRKSTKLNKLNTDESIKKNEIKTDTSSSGSTSTESDSDATSSDQTKSSSNENLAAPCKVGTRRSAKSNKINTNQPAKNKETKIDTRSSCSTSTESDSDATSTDHAKLPTTNKNLISPCQIGTRRSVKLNKLNTTETVKKIEIKTDTSATDSTSTESDSEAASMRNISNIVDNEIKTPVQPKSDEHSDVESKIENTESHNLNISKPKNIVESRISTRRSKLSNDINESNKLTPISNDHVDKPEILNDTTKVVELIKINENKDKEVRNENTDYDALEAMPLFQRKINRKSSIGANNDEKCSINNDKSNSDPSIEAESTIESLSKEIVDTKNSFSDDNKEKSEKYDSKMILENIKSDSDVKKKYKSPKKPSATVDKNISPNNIESADKIQTRKTKITTPEKESINTDNLHKIGDKKISEDTIQVKAALTESVTLIQTMSIPEINIPKEVIIKPQDKKDMDEVNIRTSKRIEIRRSKNLIPSRKYSHTTAKPEIKTIQKNEQPIKNVNDIEDQAKVDIQVEKKVDISIDIPVEKKVDISVDIPVKKKVDIPVEKKVDISVDIPVEKEISETKPIKTNETSDNNNSSKLKVPADSIIKNLSPIKSPQELVDDKFSSFLISDIPKPKVSQNIETETKLISPPKKGRPRKSRFNLEEELISAPGIVSDIIPPSIASAIRVIESHKLDLISDKIKIGPTIESNFDITPPKNIQEVEPEILKLASTVENKMDFKDEIMSKHEETMRSTVSLCSLKDIVKKDDISNFNVELDQTKLGITMPFSKILEIPKKIDTEGLLKLNQLPSLSTIKFDDQPKISPRRTRVSRWGSVPIKTNEQPSLQNIEHLVENIELSNQNILLPGQNIELPTTTIQSPVKKIDSFFEKMDILHSESISDNLLNLNFNASLKKRPTSQVRQAMCNKDDLPIKEIEKTDAFPVTAKIHDKINFKPPEPKPIDDMIIDTIPLSFKSIIDIPKTNESSNIELTDQLKDNIYADAFSGLSKEAKNHIFAALMSSNSNILGNNVEITSKHEKKIKSKEEKSSRKSKKSGKTKEKYKDKSKKDKSSNDDGDKDENAEIRRSNRIKTISATRQRSHGHGLVKSRSEQYYLDNADGQIKTGWPNFPDQQLQDFSHAIIDYQPPIKTKEQLEVEMLNEKEMEVRLSQFITIRDNIYHCEKNISKEAKKMTCDCFLTREEIDRGELGCGEDCLNRLLMIECGPKCTVGERCTNRRFQKNQYANCKVFRTEKKGFGIMAAGIIEPGEFIMEYVGEVLNSKQFEKRADDYSIDKNKHYYFMALRSDAVIDATLQGNISRFINHSCDPNAETQKWTVNGELRIGFFSTRLIMAGEEITFDYQFQRYGKEAQKCYCEASNCRGWIGEEPDSDEEFVDEEFDEANLIKQISEKSEILLEKPVEIIPQPFAPVEIAIPVPMAEENQKVEEPVISIEIPEIAPVEQIAQISPIEQVQPQPSPLQLQPPTKIEKEIRQKKSRSEIFDDADVDDEIDMLSRTGLKNQVHTLKLNRLMVRAKYMHARSRVLNLLQNGEMPCRRLFLDYHGLRLLYGWMCDCVIPETMNNLRFRLETLETLQSLPIPNKTMLKDSKVFNLVKNWASDKKTGNVESPNDDTPSDSGSGTPQQPDSSNSNSPSQQQAISENKLSADDETILIKKSIIKLSEKLLSSWDTLPEVFRIPKKERIEQMKEHEREANLRYKSLGLAAEVPEISKYDRYRERKKAQRKFGYHSESWSRDSWGNGPNSQYIDKYQRRQMFERKFAQEQQEKKKLELLRLHELTCQHFRLNPRQVLPEDVPAMVNPATGQWYTKDHRRTKTPPSHAHIKPPEQILSTNPEDYYIPEIKLPPFWKSAISNKGKIYYYHTKIRISQWEPPIFLAPLACTEEETVQKPIEEEEIEVEYDVEPEAEVNSSSTDSCDSSEDELVEKISAIQQSLTQKGQTIPKIEICDEEVTKIINDRNEKLKNIQIEDRDTLTRIDTGKASLFQKNKKSKTREGLVQERIISPRTEEDRMYGQQQSRLYRETKEKLRRRKEELRKRKLLSDSDSSAKKILKLTDGLPRAISPYDSQESDDDAGTSSSSSKPNTDSDRKIKLESLESESAVDMIESLISSSMSENDSRLLDDLKEISKEKTKNVYEEWKKQQAKLKSEARKRELSKSIGLGHKDTPPAKKKKVVIDRPVLQLSQDEVKKIKEKFRTDIAGVIVQHLNPYRKTTCKIGRIIGDSDFKHLARKLTHFVMLKELKHCDNTVNILEVTDSVKIKSREFIKKYMSKYGSIYRRNENEPDYKD